MRHPHADLIKEWAEDTSRVVQFRGKGNQEWYDADIPTLLTMSDYEWRFKPEKKPDVVRFYCVNQLGNILSAVVSTTVAYQFKLVFDGETGKLIKAEVIE